MIETDDGIDICFNALHSLNALSLITVNEDWSSKVIFSSFEQPMNEL